MPKVKPRQKVKAPNQLFLHAHSIHEMQAKLSLSLSILWFLYIYIYISLSLTLSVSVILSISISISLYISIYIRIYLYDIYLYIYIYMAKAPFCAYILAQICLKQGKKWQFGTPISRHNLASKFTLRKYPFWVSFWPGHSTPSLSNREVCFCITFNTTVL